MRSRAPSFGFAARAHALSAGGDLPKEIMRAGCKRSCRRIRNFRTHTEARPPRAARPHERPLAELSYHIYHSPGRESRHLDPPPLICMTLTVVGERHERQTFGEVFARTALLVHETDRWRHSVHATECREHLVVCARGSVRPNTSPKVGRRRRARFFFVSVH